MNLEYTNKGTDVTIITFSNDRIDAKVTDILYRLNCIVLDNETVIQGKNIKLISNKERM